LDTGGGGGGGGLDTGGGGFAETAPLLTSFAEMPIDGTNNARAKSAVNLILKSSR
jgi:hypothetical protein